MPTPDQLAKSGTEHGEQVALFAWAAVAAYRGFAAADDTRCYTDRAIADSYGVVNAVSALKWFHAIPNGGSRGDDEKSRAIRGGQLKAEGQKNGVFDTFLPVPRGRFAGLYIEMKKRDLKPKREGGAGGMSPEQQEFLAFALANHYAAIVCYTWRDAAQVVKDYMTQ